MKVLKSSLTTFVGMSSVALFAKSTAAFSPTGGAAFSRRVLTASSPSNGVLSAVEIDSDASVDASEDSSSKTRTQRIMEKTPVEGQ
jgi:hypothetical protein